MPGTTISHLAFSSGTTGKPKAAVLDHEGWQNLYRSQYLTVPSIDHDDVFLAAGPLTHATSMMVYSLLAKGGKVVVLPKFSAEGVVEAVRQHGVTITFMVPTMLNMVLDASNFTPESLRSLRAVIYAGAPMPLRTLERALEVLGPIFFQNYGQSETVPASVLTGAEHAMISADPSKRHLLKSVGRPYPDAVVEIRDADDNKLGPGEIGEITMRCAAAMVGLYDDPEATAERFTSDGLVRTRDMGYFDEDGYLYVVDRKEDMIISGGFNIWPTEIEMVVSQDEAVEHAVVFGVPDEKWGETPWVVVVPKPGATIVPDRLLDLVVEELGSMKKPARIIVSDREIPQTATGKISRGRLRDQILADHQEAIHGVN